MPSVIATDSTRRSSINSNISRATRGSARISPASTFQSRKLFHLCILGWHDADSDLGRLAEVRTIECNRRNRPTPQSLPGFLAQALEESVFDHIASLSEASVHDGAGGRAPLLDHLVGERDYRWRQFKPNRFCGLQVDHE